MNRQATQGTQKGWDNAQIRQWFRNISGKHKRSYDRDVVARVKALPANLYDVTQYGALSIDPARYPLYRVKSGHWDDNKPNILLTGGVHGYEPSGIKAAIRFLEQDAPHLMNEFNFAVYPCISPWAYEHDQRWNSDAEDPNRLFSRLKKFSRTDECVLFMDAVENDGIHFSAALDMHETPDKDIQLRQERASRFGSTLAKDYKSIPQGYYLILTETGKARQDRKTAFFGKSIIDRVRAVSPIAPEPRITGKDNKNGLVWSPPAEGVMRTYLGKYADLVGVTEVYPDHPQMSPGKSIAAQRAGIKGVLDHNRRNAPSP